MHFVTGSYVLQNSAQGHEDFSNMDPIRTVENAKKKKKSYKNASNKLKNAKKTPYKIAISTSRIRNLLEKMLVVFELNLTIPHC